MIIMLENITIYGILTLSYFAIQLSLCHKYYLKTKKRKFKNYDDKKVAIVIPSYNEDFNDLEQCIVSALEQNYNMPIITILIDDGSKNTHDFEIEYIKQKYSDKKFIYIKLPENKGKRNAQKIGFDYADWVDIIITVDSDTVLESNAVRNIIRNFDDEKIGAITGNVKAKRKNLLSMLIYARYWSAFNQERAAQSLFGSVLCCSGPLAAYRNSIIQEIKEKYIAQSFFGTKCTYGDDRHLTNLVLEKGYKVIYEPNAHAVTNVPIRIKPWLKQQTRWNRSFYREMLWTFKYIIFKWKYANPYMIYDLMMQAALPLLLMFGLTLLLINAALTNVMILFGYLLVIVIIALLRGLYAFSRTKEKVFFLFPLYAFLHVFLLLPVRLYAICTLKSRKWGTR